MLNLSGLPDPIREIKRARDDCHHPPPTQTGSVHAGRTREPSLLLSSVNLFVYWREGTNSPHAPWGQIPGPPALSPGASQECVGALLADTHHWRLTGSGWSPGWLCSGRGLQPFLLSVASSASGHLSPRLHASQGARLGSWHMRDAVHCQATSTGCRHYKRSVVSAFPAYSCVTETALLPHDYGLRLLTDEGQLPIDTSAEAAENGPRAWTPVTYLGNWNGVLDSRLTSTVGAT